MSTFLELKIEVTPLYSELLAEVLANYNCHETILSEEFFSNKNQNNTLNYLKAYIHSEENNNQTLETLKKELSNLRNLFINSGINPADLGSWEITTSIVNDQDWAESWKQYWHPQKVGKNIVICPSWEKLTPETDQDIIIELDPGSAFGTGTHPTTRLCLRALENILKELTDSTILDVGTGSGILAIAGAKLGAKKVYGIDIDPVAIEVSNINASLNFVKDTCSFSTQSIRTIQEEFDLVIVNILAKTIVSMSEEIKRVTRRGGIIILSGLIESSLEIIFNQFEELGLSKIHQDQEDEWFSIIYKRV